jgi:hypothetical protein
MRLWAISSLLLYSQNRVLRSLGNSEFDDGLGRNFDPLLRLGIKSRTCLSLLLYELAKTGQGEFAVLFHRFVRDGAECIEEYSSRLLTGLGCFGRCNLQFQLGHLKRIGRWSITREVHCFNTSTMLISVSSVADPLLFPSPTCSPCHRIYPLAVSVDPAPETARLRKRNIVSVHS